MPSFIHTNLKQWSTDRTWFYDKVQPIESNRFGGGVFESFGRFDGVYFRILQESPAPWLPGIYQISNYVGGYDTGDDGTQKMVNCGEGTASGPGATGGIGYHGLEVLKNVLVIDGNSTSGVLGQSNIRYNYSFVLLGLLSPMPVTLDDPDWNWCCGPFSIPGIGGNFANAGQTIQNAIDAGAEVDASFSSTARNVLISWFGQNDNTLGVEGFLDKLLEYNTARRAAMHAGDKIISATVTGRTAAVGGSPEYDAFLEGVNAVLRGTGGAARVGADSIADYEAVTPDPSNSDFDDGVHGSDAGQQKWAEAAYAKMEAMGLLDDAPTPSGNALFIPSNNALYLGL